MLLSKLCRRVDKSLAMSAPPEYELHGVKIRKLPVGKYIQVMRTLDDLPELLLGEAFPECTNMGEAMGALVGLNQDKMTRIALRLLTVVPEQACRLLGGLLDIPPEALLDPERGLSPAELAEVVEAFWRANDLSAFFETVRRLSKHPEPADERNTGSSAGLPPRRTSA